MLQKVWTEFNPKARGWSLTGKSADERRKLIRKALNDLRSDGHEEPVQTLERIARWLLLSDVEHGATGSPAYYQSPRANTPVISLLRNAWKYAAAVAEQDVAAVEAPAEPWVYNGHQEQIGSDDLAIGMWLSEHRAELDAVRDRIREAGGGWPEFRRWLYARVNVHGQVLETYQARLVVEAGS